jgi:hypothetical protein
VSDRVAGDMTPPPVRQGRMGNDGPPREIAQPRPEPRSQPSYEPRPQPRAEPRGDGGPPRDNGQRAYNENNERPH